MLCMVRIRDVQRTKSLSQGEILGFTVSQFGRAESNIDSTMRRTSVLFNAHFYWIRINTWSLCFIGLRAPAASFLKET